MDEKVERLGYGPQEVAKMLGCGEAAAYNIFRRADFPAIQLTENRKIVTIEALKAWLRLQQRVQVPVPEESEE